LERKRNKPKAEHYSFTPYVPPGEVPRWLRELNGDVEKKRIIRRKNSEDTGDKPKINLSFLNM
jgi:hypothetical protein